VFHTVKYFHVLVVSTSAIDRLYRLLSEITYYVSIEWDVKPYSLTHSLVGCSYHLLCILHYGSRDEIAGFMYAIVVWPSCQ